MPQRAIGKFIRERRQQLGLTQEELADLISRKGEWLSQSDISRIETGRVRFPRIERLERIAEALGVSLGDLLASVAAVSSDGQLLIDVTEVTSNRDGAQRVSFAYGPATDGSGRAEGRPEPPGSPLVQRAHFAATQLMDELIERQSSLLEAMSREERQDFGEMLAELDRIVQGWAELLREAEAARQTLAVGPDGATADVSDPEPAIADGGGFFQRLVDSIGHAVIVTEPDGSIRYWNSSAERLYGWSIDETIGRNIVDVTPTQMSREQAVEIMEHLQAGKSWSGRFRLQRRDGTSFWGNVSDTPVRDDDGNLVAIIGVSHELPDSGDMTERKNVPRLRSGLSLATRHSAG